MLQLYSSLLCERRILITSSKLSTLTACVHASAALLYPMYWQHIYIPTLPPHLLDYCGAPMPYLIGVHSSLMEQVNVGALEEVVIFNMDTNYLETPFQDLDSLPPHVGEPISFCQETFLNHKCSSMRSFLQNAVHLQLFSQFIDSRLEKLNSGDEFTDVFEQEVTKCGLSGASRSYQLWLENLKKGGGTLINNMKNRTHPTVRNMLRYAKGQAKTGLQGMKRRIKHKDQHQIQRMGSFKADGSPTQNHDRLQHRLPITQHFGQSRPRRPGKKYSESDSWECQRYGEDGTSEEVDSSPVEENDFPLLDDGMDLLNEIFETLNTRAPGRERALYGAHSLDCFSLDDNQYFGRSSEEDLRLSLSQPRHSDLWYLPEVDEGTGDNLESPEDNSSTPDNISNVSDYASPIMDVAAPDTVLTTPDTTSVTKEDIPSSSTVDLTFQKPDASSSIRKKSVSSLEMISAAPKVILETSSGTSELKIILPSPEPAICPTQKDENEKLKTVLPLLPQEDTLVRKTSSEPTHIVSGPCVRSVISRFQTGTLDPRMVWTGTKKDSEQAEKVIPNFRSFNTPRPKSQVYNSPKPNSAIHRVGPIFLRTQSTPKLDIPRSPISDTIIPLVQAQDGLTPVTPVSNMSDDMKHEMASSPVSSELKASPLPRVSELKKKFDSLQ